MFACCSIDEFDLELALEVYKAADGGTPGLRDKAAGVLDRHFDRLTSFLDETAAEPAGDGEGAGLAVGAMPEVDGVAPRAASPADQFSDDHLFNGPILRRVRDARRRAAAMLEAEGVSRADAERLVAGFSPVALLALILRYGPDLLRIVREIVAELRGN